MLLANDGDKWCRERLCVSFSGSFRGVRDE
jgi:hypothetical protein